MKRSRAGGVLSALLIAIGLLVFVIFVTTGYVLRHAHVQRYSTARGNRVRVETPMGSIGVDETDNLDPASVGVPVYPGSAREHNHSGGALVDLDWAGSGHKQLSVVGAAFSTGDSVEQVRDFYRARFPHWIFSQKDGRNAYIQFSKDGSERIIAIKQRDGRTHIGIVSIGEPAVN